MRKHNKLFQKRIPYSFIRQKFAPYEFCLEIFQVLTMLIQIDYVKYKNKALINTLNLNVRIETIALEMAVY